MLEIESKGAFGLPKFEFNKGKPETFLFLSALIPEILPVCQGCSKLTLHPYVNNGYRNTFYS